MKEPVAIEFKKPLSVTSVVESIEAREAAIVQKTQYNTEKCITGGGGGGFAI